MKCVSCGSRMNKTRGSYAYATFPGTTLLDVDIYRCPSCGEEEVSIPRIAELNRTIARELVRRKVAELGGPAEMTLTTSPAGWKAVA